MAAVHEIHSLEGHEFAYKNLNFSVLTDGDFASYAAKDCIVVIVVQSAQNELVLTLHQRRRRSQKWQLKRRATGRSSIAFVICLVKMRRT